MIAQTNEVYYIIRSRGRYGYMSSADYLNLPTWAAGQIKLLGACPQERHAKELVDHLPQTEALAAYRVMDPPPQPPGWGAWEQQDFVNYSFGATVAAAGASYMRRRPVRNASLESDVAVPGIQAIITSLVAGLSGWGILTALEVSRPGLGGITFGVLALSAAWLVLLRDHRSLLWEVEEVIPKENNKPNTEKAFTTVEITDRKQGSIRYVDVPLDEEELRRLATGVLVQRRHFSRRSLVDAGFIVKEKYGDVLELFLSSGLARAKGTTTNAGVELTGAGRAFLKQYLAPHPTE
jgi:hypothetical protein